MCRIRVDERDLETEESLPRLLVDQLGTLVGELRERRADVVDLVGDVVHPRPALREKPADVRVGAEGREELDPALADPQ